MQRLATRDESDTNLESVVPHAADVALAKLRRPFSDVTLARLVGVRHGDRSRRLDLDWSRARFGHEGVAVEEACVPVELLHAQRAIEGRWQPERHLDLVGVDERGESTARIAAVG
jgi:hypothetical protein